MNLITYKGMKGYKLSDISKFLGNEELLKKFDEYMRGRTIMRYKGEDFIYVQDWERFINTPL